MPALRGTPLRCGSAREPARVGDEDACSLAASGAGVRQTGSGDAHPGRRSSYTEQALAAAVETVIAFRPGEARS